MENLMEIFETQNNLMMYIEARAVAHGSTFWKNMSDEDCLADGKEWMDSQAARIN